MKERNVAVCIILSIITCGIYAIYWMYTISEDMVMVNETYTMSGAKVVLLSLVTCGIYGIFWAYKVGGMLNEEGQRRNVNTSSNPAKCLVWYFLGVVVALAIMQSDINKLGNVELS
jgi:hypothetical protein